MDKVFKTPIANNLPAYEEGQVVTFPKLVVFNKHHFKCPCCGQQWRKTGSGTGFVKRGAASHVAKCFEDFLKELALKMGPYDNKNYKGWYLVKVTE